MFQKQSKQTFTKNIQKHKEKQTNNISLKNASKTSVTKQKIWRAKNIC